ncbi:MAG: general stress protein [Candidatus Eremiobacteraeota bacterium]|nr:general stress protein [Candidatus Eremiobacteraeota bacterium]MBC5826984.1 general stress protein [Candidatus Eremiobacteraeota bacterium]
MALQDMETGVYFDRESARGAIEELHRMGYGNDEIHVMMNDSAQAQDFASQVGALPLSVPQGNGRQYESDLHRGAILVGVRPRGDDGSRLSDLFTRPDATYGTGSSRMPGSAGVDRDDDRAGSGLVGSSQGMPTDITGSTSGGISGMATPTAGMSDSGMRTGGTQATNVSYAPRSHDDVLPRDTDDVAEP